MSGVVDVLTRELNDLERAVREDPRHKKIEHIKELLELYGPQQKLDAPPTRPAADVVPSKSSKASANDSGSKASRVKAAVYALLMEEGSLHRSDILKRLIDDGLMGHEANPLSNLAAYLSDWRRDFATDGKGNFSIAESSAEDTKSPDAQASELL